MPEVKLVNITKKYGKVIAADNVNLHIQDKEYVTILGPSGCGKTTIIKIIAGIIEPDEGEVYINGKKVNEVPPEDRGVGYVFQNIVLFPNMNVWDNITYGPRVKNWSQTQTSKLAREMLELIRLTVRSDAYPNELSGGMQQKVATARALTSGANLLLLDEPLGALDARVRAELRHELRRLVKDLGLTALHVTHDQEEAMAISDRIVIMKKGRIIETGTPEELYTKPKTIFGANFVGEANFMEGRVTKIGENEVGVEVRGGLIIRTSDKYHIPEEKVVIAIRPEYITLEAGEKPQLNGLYGYIEKRQFLGGFIRYEVRLDNGDIIAVHTPSALDMRSLDINTRVTSYVNPENVLVYTYPAEGLKTALALE
jgi:ABC-type Fe3+/spermidine/putrescine transport system ATPase subunit